MLISNFMSCLPWCGLFFNRSRTSARLQADASAGACWARPRIIDATTIAPAQRRIEKHQVQQTLGLYFSFSIRLKNLGSCQDRSWYQAWYFWYIKWPLPSIAPAPHQRRAMRSESLGVNAGETGQDCSLWIIIRDVRSSVGWISA